MENLKVRNSLRRFASFYPDLTPPPFFTSSGDASVTRGDFLAPDENNNCRSYPRVFKQLLDRGSEVNPEDGRITPSLAAWKQLPGLAATLTDEFLSSLSLQALKTCTGCSSRYEKAALHCKCP